MCAQQLTSENYEQLWAEVLRMLDTYAGRSLFYEVFAYKANRGRKTFYTGRSGGMSGTIEVCSPVITVKVHSLRGEEVNMKPIRYRLIEAWQELTTPQLTFA